MFWHVQAIMIFLENTLYCFVLIVHFLQIQLVKNKLDCNIILSMLVLFCSISTFLRIQCLQRLKYNHEKVQLEDMNNF